MTLREYEDCLNTIGEAAWYLEKALHTADTPHFCAGVSDAFELARLALHQLIGAVSAQADRNHGDNAINLGDPGACLESQELMLREDGPAPYWPIAGLR